MAGTLQSLAVEVDERRYVSREEVAGRIEALLGPDSPHRILLVHGPGGIGKSAVLREVARRAERSGYSVLRLDGRWLAESSSLADELFRALPGDAPGRFAVVIDEIDALGAGLRALGVWIAGLPGSVRVILAGRARPARDWIDEGLHDLVVACRLAPLTEEQSRELLRRLDLKVSPGADSVVRWAMGSPLALVVAARASLRSAASDLNGAGESSRAERGALASGLDPGAIEDLIERIAGFALNRDDRQLLQAASISWSVDEAQLAAVLPERDGARSLARLIELDFVERLDDRAVVHPIVARAVAERLQVEDPRLFVSLTMRAASHLRDRAIDGDSSALADLANLVRDPVLRDGLGPAFSERFYADRLRGGDLEAAGFGVERELWRVVEPWLRLHANECVVARSRSGDCVGVSVALGAMSVAELGGPYAHQAGRATGTGVASTQPADGLALPLLKLAERLEQPERAVISPIQLTFDREAAENRRDLMRFMNAMAVMRCGVPNPRYDIVNDIGWTDQERDVASRYGYEELPELRRSVGGHEVRTWFADSGGGGLAGLIYGVIAAENGIEISSEATWAEVVPDALESFHDDAALARLPIAPHGYDQAAAAAIVRTRLRSIIDRALAGEPELHRLIEARYVTPGQSHDTAMRATFQSRSSYYRKLRRARQAIIAAAELGP